MLYTSQNIVHRRRQRGGSYLDIKNKRNYCQTQRWHELYIGWYGDGKRNEPLCAVVRNGTLYHRNAPFFERGVEALISQHGDDRSALKAARLWLVAEANKDLVENSHSVEE